jgi:hypothetical protein
LRDDVSVFASIFVGYDPAVSRFRGRLQGKKQCTTTRTTPQHHLATHLSLLHFSMISLMFLYLKQRQAFKKPLEVSLNHFQMNIWQIKRLLRVQHIF